MSLLKNRLRVTQSQSPYKLRSSLFGKQLHSQESFSNLCVTTGQVSSSRNIYEQKKTFCNDEKKIENRRNSRLTEMERENRSKNLN